MSTRTTSNATRGPSRATSGRFAIGNPGGPGRPRRQTEGAYLGTMMEVVSLDTWKTIVTAAVTAAQAGDHQARQWLARYLVGEPSTTAPTPLSVVIDTLLARDEAMDKATAILAEPHIAEVREPLSFFRQDTDREAAILAEAREVLRQAEEGAS